MLVDLGDLVRVGDLE